MSFGTITSYNNFNTWNSWAGTFCIVLAVLIFIFKIIPMMVDAFRFKHLDKVARRIYMEYKSSMTYLDYKIKNFVYLEENIYGSSICKPFGNECAFISFIAQTYIVKTFIEACETSYNRDDDYFCYKKFIEFFNKMGFDDIEDYVDFCCIHVIKEYSVYKHGNSGYSLLFTPDTSLDDIVRIHNRIKFCSDYFNINGEGLAESSKHRLSIILENVRTEIKE